ncbi:MAG: tripartite tricarboxylate transporter substrate binding protein [Devosia sp.]|nr:tripartite tricarboxylate transporter substrate binding protein [Devosia sp.]
MNSHLHRRTTLSLLAGATLAPCLAGTGLAAAYPDHPIHVMVPFSAGGAVDIVARAVMQKVGPLLGESIVVEDRPGANGNIAPALVAKAAPDGYTMLIGANGLATNGTLFDNLPFDALKDLEPVALVGYSPLILIMRPTSPPMTVKKLVAMAKAAPGKLTFASAGNGTSGHLAAEIFKQVVGIDALHVPYKGGAQALVDIIGGRITFMFLDPVQVMPQVRGNQLQAIAVSAPERLSLLPDVPTMAEAGYPGVEATVWWGFLFPAKTPAEIVTRVNHEINAALQDPKVKGSLVDMGVVIKGGSPEDFAAFLQSETKKWGTLIRTTGIKAD